MSEETAPTATPAPDAAPAPDAPAAEAPPAEPTLVEAAPSEAPAEEAPAAKTEDFVILQREQRKLHQKRKELEATVARERAEIEATKAYVEQAQKDLGQFRAIAAKAMDDPFAILQAMNINPGEYLVALSEKVLGEAPTGDERVDRLERELKKRDAEAKAAAERQAKEQKEAAERAQAAQYERVVATGVQQVRSYLAADPEDRKSTRLNSSH